MRALFVLALGCMAAVAQDRETLTYRIYAADHQIGSEEVTLRVDGGRIRVVSDLKLEHKREGKIVPASYHTELIADAKTLVPERYTVRGQGPGGPSQFDFEIEGERVKLTGRAGGRPIEAQEEKRSAGAILYDGIVIGHMAAVLRTFMPDPGGRRSTRATLTADLSEVELLVEDKGEANLVGAGEVIPVRRIFVGLDPVGLMAYVDRKGRLLLFRNPFNDTRIALDGYEKFTVVRRGAPSLPEGTKEETLTFEGAESRLAASVVRPKEASDTPGVLLISGPGAVDRDGNTLDLRIDLYRVLAYELAKAGSTVLRYDKRGVGRSEGRLSTATLNDLVEDADAALRRLRRMDGLKSVSVIGHGEGALIGAILAARDPSIRSLVLLASPGMPMDELLLRQYREASKLQKLPEARIAKEVRSRREHFDRIKAAEGDWLEMEKHGRVFVGWLREHFNHDPLATIGKVRSNVVVVHGLRDRLVLPENADRIDAALKEAGHKKFEVMRFEKLDHMFMESSDGTIARFAEDRPIDPAFLGYVVDALGRHGSER